MAKNPKDRHYQKSEEPTTIDLGPDEVTRLDKEAPGGETPGEAALGEAEADAVAEANAALDAETPAGDAAELTPDAGKPTDEVARTAVEEGVREEYPQDTVDETADGGEPQGRGAPAAAVPPARKSGGIGMVAAGLIGSAVTLAGAGGAWYAGLLPERSAGESSQVEGFMTEIAALKSQTAENKALIENASGARPAGDTAALDALSKEIGRIAEEVKGLGADFAVMRSSSGNPADAEAAAKLGDRLKGLEDRLAALPAEGATPADAATLGPVIDEKIAGVTTAITEVRTLAEGAVSSAREAAKSAVSNAEALTGLTARADKLDEQLAALSGKVSENSGQGEVARTIAAAALKSAIDRGVPFMTELETFAQITGDSEAIGALRNMAASGVPTRGALSEMAPDAAYAMIAATETVPADAGILDRLAQSARGLVKMRSVGEVEGEGVQAITARMEAAVQRGDYAKALEEYEAMPAEAKAAGAEFAGKVKARMEADRLIEDVLAEALRSAAKEG